MGTPCSHAAASPLLLKLFKVRDQTLTLLCMEQSSGPERLMNSVTQGHTVVEAVTDLSSVSPREWSRSAGAVENRGSGSSWPGPMTSVLALGHWTG